MIRRLIRYLMLERPANKVGLTGFPARLTENGKKLLIRIKNGSDTPENRRQLNHVIGIERWGQSRLRVALGDPLQMDEYTGYRPARERSWGDLKEDFETTRAATVALAEQLAQANVATDLTIPHNQHGDLTVPGWLYYLDMHANLESRRIK